MGEIGIDHVELIKIGEQRIAAWVHTSTSVSRRMCLHSSICPRDVDRPSAMRAAPALNGFMQPGSTRGRPPNRLGYRRTRHLLLRCEISPLTRAAIRNPNEAVCVTQAGVTCQ